MRSFKLFFIAACAAICLTSCLDKAEESFVAFPKTEYSFDEDAGLVSVPVRLYNTPELYPVKVTVLITSHEGLITVDNSEIEVEITNENDSQVYFTINDDNELNPSTKKFDMTIVGAKGSKVGTLYATTVTIVDDEYAPRINMGDYNVKYTNPFTTFRKSNEFTLTLRKVGKYTYAAYGWFGLDAPRLEGTFDPDNNTLTFDGKVHKLDESDADNAFGTAYWFNNLERTEILVFEGSGIDGTGSIVLSTPSIGINETGSITVAATDCRFDLYNCTVDSKGKITVGSYIGIYDNMPAGAVFTLSDDDDTKAQRNDAVLPIRIATPVSIR